MAQLDGTCKGFFLLGENPAVGSANAQCQRLGLANLDWLVVRDFALIETATWWKDGPEIETGEMRTEDIGTEVFFFPAAAHTEKSGTLHQHPAAAAVAPPGGRAGRRRRSDLWFIYHLGRLMRERLAGSTDDRRTGRCSTSPGTTRRRAARTSRAPRRCCAEINGYDGRRAAAVGATPS